ncbi:NEL-type E3 ubiquitin ligase domain-containing protein [Pseudomonas sp. LP_4_YM]|uniref:NEL-type E3 ubiquitin ligase domain-containing protein n=1 Tax=Pseudomonas sp. LP_4_YM TaxID=2485135 RepID=UPI001046F3AB|nr:NEL-type E3 ubiquitin ligase domain-containing protein [Pseudomonas sp. LP_4_YM]TCT92029.1 leucine rich repeat (LRR) protein [Pseudomonas sp. LP_4_YM]
MTASLTTAPGPNPSSAKVASATHDFIAARLPEWLKRGSPAQLNRLRDRFKAHQGSQERVRAFTRRLIPLQSFAELHMQRLVAHLPGSPALDALQWREIRRNFKVPHGMVLPVDEVIEVREPAVLRLMQNFNEQASFYLGTGLVSTGEDALLTAGTDALVQACRDLDAGGRYQKLLSQVFTDDTCQALIADKRAAFALATEVAALRGDLTARQQIALAGLANDEVSHAELGAYPGMLSMLGHTLSDVVVVQLRDRQGVDRGIVLYRPSDPGQALRHFTSIQEMNTVLAAALQKEDYRAYFSQLVSVEERARFLDTLSKRLSDAVSDLSLEGVTGPEDIFSRLVDQQVQRIKDDARLLLVPTAQVDRDASEARRKQWRSLGWNLVNLAGLFIPVVGAMLLGQLVVQTLSEVFEGATDWYHGHQHEALEQMLGVAETLAVTAVVGAGANILARGYAATDFVEGLEPVRGVDGKSRLWANDLKVYASLPEDPQLHSDGLYRDWGRAFFRSGKRYFRAHRPDPNEPWRLRHARRPAGFGPVLEHFGERSWQLNAGRAVEMDQPDLMLEQLWPQPRSLTHQQASRVMQAAGMDVAALRGLLVEARDIPASLCDSLERFEASARVSRFFTALQHGASPRDESALVQWCLEQTGSGSLVQLQENLLEHADRLRGLMFQHLCQVPAVDDPLSAVIRTGMPGLPERYVQALAADVGRTERDLALSMGKLPLRCLRQGASLLRVARLTRAMCGVYLPNAYCDEAGELALALLQRLDAWPARHIELWTDGPGARRIAAVGNQLPGANLVKIVHKEGRFRAIEEPEAGYGAVVDESNDFYQTLLALLEPSQRTALDLDGDHAASTLRDRLIEQLPETHAEVEQLLGWPRQDRWFNPGRRMPDGRIGYPLSGSPARRRNPDSLLRSRLRNLYPGLDDSAIDNRLARLLTGPHTAYDALLELEEDHADLERHLSRWTGFESNPARQRARRQVADQIRRAWRQMGEPLGDETAGQRLSIINLNVGSLPELPAHIEFELTRSLVIRDVPITHMPTGFLSSFTRLRELNLSSTGLLGVPTEVAYLVDLRTLRLARNNIRLNDQALNALTRLPQLTHLDLSYNPLGAFEMRYNQLTRLVELNLRRCRLGAWPSGLELCSTLERADLRDNLLHVVPAEIVQLPHARRMGFMVERNRLSSVEMQRLFALDSIAEHFHLPEPRRVIDRQVTRDLWLDAGDPHLRVSRQALWSRLVADPGSDGLVRLLGLLGDTGDYDTAPFQLAERVWALLEAVDANEQLRQRIHSLARLPLTCMNTVADRFSELQVRALIDRSEHNVAPERGNELLGIGQQLFRLDRLEQVARRDVLQRLAALERVDQAAVSLAYRVRLRARLNLPCQPHSMLYADVAELTSTQLENAYREVIAAMTPDALSMSLSQRVFWANYIHERHTEVFEALHAQFAARRSALALRQSTLDAIDYQLLLDSLDTEQATQGQSLVFELTRQFLIGRERGLS